MEEILILAEATGLQACIDDAYLERGDWQTLVLAFAEAVRAADRAKRPNINRHQLEFDAKMAASLVPAGAKADQDRSTWTDGG